VPSILAADHDVAPVDGALEVRTCPSISVAAQNDADAHEIVASADPGSIE
jgi:hypothetical protein